MKSFRNLRRQIVLAGAVVCGTAGLGSAAPLSNAYVLNIPSGSYFDGQYRAFLAAYQQALGSVLTDGSIGLGVLQFSGHVEEIVPFTILDSVAARQELIAKIGAAMPNDTDDEVNIAASISQSTAILDQPTGACRTHLRCVIDFTIIANQSVYPGNPADASAAAIAAGVHQINCTGITFEASCEIFAAGDDYYINFARDLTDFEQALQTKFQSEGLLSEFAAAPVPLPPSALLLMGGLAGLAALRGRRGISS